MSEQKTVNNNFWDSRTKKYGHTGWANPLIYAFDQQARLMAIDKLLCGLKMDKTDSALDFGTGSGDFSELLSKKFKNVIGFDISENVIKVAKKKFSKISSIEFISEKKIDETNISNNSLDLILSVTVLGHILDSAELKKTLTFLHEKVKKGGYLIALEYCDTNQRPVNKYQKFSSAEQWAECFSSSGFKIETKYGFFYPANSSVDSYRKYLSNPQVKFYKAFKVNYLLERSRFILDHFSQIANNCLKGESDLYWDEKNNDDLKIFILKKE